MTTFRSGIKHFTTAAIYEYSTRRAKRKSKLSKRVLRHIRGNQRNAWGLSSGEWFEQLTFQSLDPIQNYFQTTYPHTYNQPTNQPTNKQTNKHHEVEVFLRS
jgi:hypothetical protein